MDMMTSSHGNAFHVTGPLWGESIIHRWFPLAKFQWCGTLMFSWYTPEQTVAQTMELLVIWDAMAYDVTVMDTTFIKPDQLDPWIKDQIKITLLPTISHLLLPNFVSCGRACPSHLTQNLVTVGAKLWTADRFLVDPWSMDYADPVW